MKNGKYKLIDDCEHVVIEVDEEIATCIEVKGESDWSVGDIEDSEDLVESWWEEL